MALTHEEIQELKREIFAEADKKYVAIDTCNEKQSEVNSKFANDDKRIDRILLLQEGNTKALQKNNWLTTAVLGVIISIVVAMILKSIGVF